MNSNLVFDLGFHIGQDTDFYLRKGFTVIAVDANPHLVAEGKKKFANNISDGSLTLINVGIGSRVEKLPFYVNRVLSEWSSFDKKIGTGRGEFTVMEIPLVTLRSLVEQYGVPYYIKIDIEGHDLMAIQSLRGLEDMPRYISVENGQAHMIEELHSQGYEKFKFVNQARIQDVVLPRPAREGRFVDYTFQFGSSGPFGEEIEAPWLDKESVIAVSKHYWENPERDASIHGWFDLHAARY